MEVQLTSDQQAFAQQAVKAGRVDSVEGAVRQALGLWEARERRRAELLAVLDAAEASLDRGEGRLITNGLREDVRRGVKERGRALLAAEQASR